MKSIGTACMVGLLFVVGSGLQAQEAKPFSSKEGRFTVRFPKEPKEQVQEKDTPAGKTNIHLFISEAGADGGYIVSYNDYQAGLMNDANREAALDGAQKGAAQSSNGTIKETKKITLGKEKHSGREYLMALPGGKLFFRSRIFIVGDRLYQVIAVGPEDFVKNDGSTKFIDSFRILAASK